MTHTSVVRAAHQRRKLKRTEEVESKRRDYDYQVKGAVDRFYMMALSNRGLGKVDQLLDLSGFKGPGTEDQVIDMSRMCQPWNGKTKFEHNISKKYSRS